METVSVVGLGKLGLCMAACMAAKGNRVIGVDIDQKRIEQVNRLESPTKETGLESLLKSSHGNLSATDDFQFAVSESDITFVVVATPSEPDESYSTAQVEAAMRSIGASLKTKERFHVVALTSTVMPGTTDSVVIPTLEITSQRKCGSTFGVAYNPEFIAMGSVIHDFQNPDFVLIGATDDKTGDRLARLYGSVCENNPRIAKMNPTNAEIAKISLNCFVTMKITFANALGQICERIPTADVDTITDAIGLDTRIGSRYLRAGLGYGGPCFPRDNRAFSFLARTVGLEAILATTVDEVNSNQAQRIVELVERRSTKGAKIALLGLAYKPNTDIVEGSQSIHMALELARKGRLVSAYDSLATANARAVLGDKIRYAPTIGECLKGADICIVALPSDEFRKLEASDFVQNMNKGGLVLDCWRLFNGSSFRETDYLALGLGQGARTGASQGNSPELHG